MSRVHKRGGCCQTDQVTDPTSPLCSGTDPEVCPKLDGSRSLLTSVSEFLLTQGIMPMDDALQIPPAVKRACAKNRRVASAPVPTGSSTLMTPSPTPSPYTKDNSERMVSAHRYCWCLVVDRWQDSALQNAFNPGSVPVRHPTNLRTVSMKAPSRRGPYPGEGILDLSLTADPNILRT